MCFNAFVSRGASSFNSCAWSPASRPRTCLPLRVTRKIARLLSSASAVRASSPSRSERSTSSTVLLCFNPSRSAAYAIVTAVSLRSARHLQKKLMLLRLQSCFQSCAFAEVQKASQFIAKLSQCPEQ